jgi:endonuclease-3
VKAKQVFGLLEKQYPDAHCALTYTTAVELLVATILSAQCTDERVNKVTKPLFRKYRNAKDFANADLNELEDMVKSTGFYKNKARNIQNACKILVANHKAHVPQDMDILVELPGVGRKTANVVLGNAFGIASGVVVDTHVGRLSRRMGFTKNSDPVKVEMDLQKLFPRSMWVMLSHLLIFHGRQVCKARNPDCEKCFLKTLCPQKL